MILTALQIALITALIIANKGKLDDGIWGKIFEIAYTNPKSKKLHNNNNGVATKGKTDIYTKVFKGNKIAYLKTEIKINEGNAMTETEYKTNSLVMFATAPKPSTAIDIDFVLNVLNTTPVYIIPVNDFLENVPRKTYGTSKNGFGIKWRKSQKINNEWVKSPAYIKLENSSTIAKPNCIYSENDF